MYNIRYLAIEQIAQGVQCFHCYVAVMAQAVEGAFGEPEIVDQLVCAYSLAAERFKKRFVGNHKISSY